MNFPADAMMSKLGDPSFDERRKAAAASKAELLKKFKAAPQADDPEVQARAAQRRVVADEREARRRERDRQKGEEAARVVDELATATAEVGVPPKGFPSAPLSDDEIEAERKAQRDRRYAARKARQR